MYQSKVFVIASADKKRSKGRLGTARGLKAPNNREKISVAALDKNVEGEDRLSAVYTIAVLGWGAKDLVLISVEKMWSNDGLRPTILKDAEEPIGRRGIFTAAPSKNNESKNKRGFIWANELLDYRRVDLVAISVEKN